MQAGPLLAVDGLSLAFGRHIAVQELDFSLAAGETLALVGESGSGKSATALAIMRLIEREGGRITAGRVTLAGSPGLELSAMSDQAMRKVRGNRLSMIFQEPMTALNPVMPLGRQVEEVLKLHQGLVGARARYAAQEAFERVRIPDARRRLDQYPHQLSGGLRQRVMIAMALACRPDVLIADEPTTALDVTTQAEVLSLIQTLQQELRMGVLFITHDMGVVAEIADRMVVLRAGRKVEEGPVRDVFARPQAAYTRMLMAATPRLGAGAPPPLPALDRAANAPPPVLTVEDLAVRYRLQGGLLPFRVRLHHAVNGVSLVLRRGETLGLVGESGCGKSTVARAILRLIEPAEGRISLLGQDITRLSAAELRPWRRQMQIVFQDPYASLNPRLPVVDLVTEPALIHGVVPAGGQRSLAAALLARVGLEPDAVDRFAHQFSGGQRQRLCIARALSVHPALIVADEPVSALDVSVARQVTDLMAQLQREEGLAFLFISHDLAVVERVSHRIAVMYAGQIVETGPTAEVLARPRHPYTKRLLAAVPVPDPERSRRQRVALGAAPPLPQDDQLRPRRWPLSQVSPEHYVAAS